MEAYLILLEETIDRIVTNHIDSFPVYTSNHGPISIKVVDPTSVKAGDFVIMMDTVQDFIGWKLYEKAADGFLSLLEVSDVSINEQYEQIITSLGISINMQEVTTPTTLTLLLAQIM